MRIGPGNWKGAKYLVYVDKRHRRSILSLHCSVSRHQLLDEGEVVVKEKDVGKSERNKKLC